MASAWSSLGDVGGQLGGDDELGRPRSGTCRRSRRTRRRAGSRRAARRGARGCRAPRTRSRDRRRSLRRRATRRRSRARSSAARSSSRSCGLADPDRRAHVGRLHEHRVAELGLQPATAASSISCSYRVTWRACGMPAAREHVLGLRLVHGQRRGQHAAAHVGHAGQLEQALDGAVLAQRSVQEGEHDDLLVVGAGQCLGRVRGRAPGGQRLGERSRTGGERRGPHRWRPSTGRLGDGDRLDVVAVGVGGGQDVAGRHQGHLVLGRLAAEQDDEADRRRVWRRPAVAPVGPARRGAAGSARRGHGPDRTARPLTFAR